MRAFILLPFLLASAAFGGGLTAPPASPSSASMQCLIRLQDKLDTINAKLNNEYLYIDPEDGAIPEAKKAYGIPPATNAHEDEVVLIIHGFSASPNESKTAGVSISAAGYPVVMALLSGFGSSTKVANSYTTDDWRQAVAEYADLMALCYKKVHLVGFSLGGGLVSDFLLTHPSMGADGVFLSSRGSVRILSATLLSPYFETGSALTDWVVAKLHEKLGIEGISVQALYSVLTWLNLRSPANDLKALANYPSRFNKDLPLGAAEQVARLGQRLRSLPAVRKTPVSVFLSYSEIDHTISREQADAFVRAHYPAFRPESDALVFPAAMGVPHQITLPAWNPELERLLSEINTHLGAASVQ